MKIWRRNWLFLKKIAKRIQFDCIPSIQLKQNCPNKHSFTKILHKENVLIESRLCLFKKNRFTIFFSFFYILGSLTLFASYTTPQIHTFVDDSFYIIYFNPKMHCWEFRIEEFPNRKKLYRKQSENRKSV